MKRRHFLRNTSLAFLGSTTATSAMAATGKKQNWTNGKTAKNIIFMISDGMSNGTLSMADLYSRNILGKPSHWMQLYEEGKVYRALMDTASANSIVTDSAAASSSFGGGVRVNNGSLNVGANGEKHKPIWQKFKQQGKKTGCVTTVPITHATPAGFCVNSSKRSAEPEIAEMYAEIGIDVLIGGGDEFFNPKKREDKKDVYALYRQKGYQVVNNNLYDLQKIEKSKPLLSVFGAYSLPYTIDREYISTPQKPPTLAELTNMAIHHLNNNEEGFVLQVEAGKVDWAAHANDISALIHDQLAFDEALKVVMDFAEKDGNTLVIFTTDHANANPGTIYGSDATKKFNSIANYKYTNEYVLNGIKDNFNIQQIKDWIYEANGIRLQDDEGRALLKFYNGLEKENGLYNYKKLPFKLYSEIQKKHNGVGWISMDHSGDYVELAMYGPGSEMLNPFIKNYELHHFMLTTAGVAI